jgi:hypothetical protein
MGGLVGNWLTRVALGNPVPLAGKPSRPAGIVDDVL